MCFLLFVLKFVININYKLKIFSKLGQISCEPLYICMRYLPIEKSSHHTKLLSVNTHTMYKEFYVKLLENAVFFLAFQLSWFDES